MTEVNTFRVSEVLWGFQNICFHGSAKEASKQANMLDGLNGWRLVIYEMRSSLWVRVRQLRQSCEHVPSIDTLEDIGPHTTKYEANIREYVAAAGAHVKPTDEEMKEDLMESLPRDTREALQTRLGPLSRTHTYVELRNEVRSAPNALLDQRGKIKASVNNVDVPPGAAPA